MADGPPKIFDRAAYRARRQRAKGDPFLAAQAAELMAERLGTINRHFAIALDLSSRQPSFEALQHAAQNWVRVAPVADPDAPTIVADEEYVPFADASFDLVVSVLSLHAVNDLPGALVQIRRVLKPDGLFLAAMFGGDTLTELRQAFVTAEAEITRGISPRVAPFADVRELGGLLQRAGFTLPVADVERTLVRYRELKTLFSDLRGLGETNSLKGRRTSLLTRSLLAAVTKEYSLHFADPDGRFRATFAIVYLIGWAPHESQQKPLLPGSAKTSLAEALGTVERPTGEKPTR